MFGSITGMFNHLIENRYVQQLATNITNNYEKLKEQVSLKMHFQEIVPNIFYIEYPQIQKVQQLKKHIANSQFQIWNLSEYKYDSDLQLNILGNNEEGEIHNLCYQFYTNIPLYELLMAVNTIRNFTSMKKSNKVYIHCQDNRIRSGIFLSCYIYQNRINEISDISQAILFINQQLAINIEEDVKENNEFSIKNQHIMFKNYINYQNNKAVVNKNRLKLLKIIINNAPTLTINPHLNIDHTKHIKIALEIRSGQKILLKKLYSNSIFQGNCLCIKLQKTNLQLSDQFLIIVKYFYEGNIYNLFRLQLNSNFVFQSFLRIYEQDIDLSPSCIRKANSLMHLDLIFQNLKELSNLALLKEQTVNQLFQVEKQQSRNVNSIDNKYQKKPQTQLIRSQQIFKSKQVLNIGQQIQPQLPQQVIPVKSAQKQMPEDLFEIMNENQLEIDDELTKKIQQAIIAVNSKGQEEDEDLDDYFSKLEQQS